jgi:hypothetical protein
MQAARLSVSGSFRAWRAGSCPPGTVSPFYSLHAVGVLLPDSESPFQSRKAPLLSLLKGKFLKS